MTFDIFEAINYYRNLGAPSDQGALINLLKEVQAESNDHLSLTQVNIIAKELAIKSTFILGIIKRFPSLHLENTHDLLICNGMNCAKKVNFVGFIEKTYGKNLGKINLKYVNCMRQCLNGPNFVFDGETYNHATIKDLEAIINQNKQSCEIFTGLFIYQYS